MSPWMVFVAVARVPLAIAVVIEWRARRELRRFEAARLAEVRESVDAYEAEEEVTQRRYSYSGWPFPNKK